MCVRVWMSRTLWRPQFYHSTRLCPLFQHKSAVNNFSNNLRPKVKVVWPTRDEVSTWAQVTHPRGLTNTHTHTELTFFSLSKNRIVEVSFCCKTCRSMLLFESFCKRSRSSSLWKEREDEAGLIKKKGQVWQVCCSCSFATCSFYVKPTYIQPLLTSAMSSNDYYINK